MSGPNPNESQQRFDPFLQEWVIYAPSRSKRPFQGKKFDSQPTPKKTWTCPFCPDAPEGAGEWIVKQLSNKFASLSETAPPFQISTFGEAFQYQVASNYGKCEVILYSQDHHASFGKLPEWNIEALIKLWQERYKTISEIKEIRYPFIMENRGKEIGNSMIHPHGQIYSFPYLPPKILREFNAVNAYYEKNHRCLHCDIVAEELKNKSRIVEENPSFLAEIPYYAHWPFEIHIITKAHKSSIDELNSTEISDLAKIMKKIVQRYDLLYQQPPFMPYVMAMHNAPTNVPHHERWHFHIEYYTPFRGPEKWKFLAGVELGTHTYISDALPEYNAELMRNLKI